MADTQLHILTAQSPDIDTTLPRIIAFSNDIFSPDLTTKYASLSYWKDRLSDPSSVILYFTAPEDPTTLIGFLFAHPRTHAPPLPSGLSETLHIWLAGVSPHHRNAGCLRKMVDVVLLSSRESGLVVTVCTVPARFPDMWRWLKKRGWRVEREMGGGKICLSQPAAVDTIDNVPTSV